LKAHLEIYLLACVEGFTDPSSSQAVGVYGSVELVVKVRVARVDTALDCLAHKGQQLLVSAAVGSKGKIDFFLKYRKAKFQFFRGENLHFVFYFN
jgi:hypothetical protein